MKLLTGLPEPKGLLPAADLRLIRVQHRWYSVPSGGVLYTMRIGEGEWSLPEWMERTPFVELE